MSQVEIHSYYNLLLLLQLLLLFCSLRIRCSVKNASMSTCKRMYFRRLPLRFVETEFGFTVVAKWMRMVYTAALGASNGFKDIHACNIIKTGSNVCGAVTRDMTFAVTRSRSGWRVKSEQ